MVLPKRKDISMGASSAAERAALIASHQKAAEFHDDCVGQLTGLLNMMSDADDTAPDPAAPSANDLRGMIEAHRKAAKQHRDIVTSYAN